jgi:hypothetical protein
MNDFDLEFYRSELGMLDDTVIEVAFIKSWAREKKDILNDD